MEAVRSKHGSYKDEIQPRQCRSKNYVQIATSFVRVRRCSRLADLKTSTFQEPRRYSTGIMGRLGRLVAGMATMASGGIPRQAASMMLGFGELQGRNKACLPTKEFVCLLAEELLKDDGTFCCTWSHLAVLQDHLTKRSLLGCIG